MFKATQTLNQVFLDAESRRISHLFTNDETITGKTLSIDNQKLTNFGSCSYLGLETNSILKEGAIDAVNRFGTQFSSSRTYLSLGLYHELESMLRDIFEKPLIVTASTTLGHLATLPVIIGENDAIVLDLQVHSSVQMACKILKARKVPIYVIPHNNMEALEKKIKNLNNQYDRIWYLADGVYSMYGDFAPFEKLEYFLNKYAKFHLYIDCLLYTSPSPRDS